MDINSDNSFLDDFSDSSDSGNEDLDLVKPVSFNYKGQQ